MISIGVDIGTAQTGIAVVKSRGKPVTYLLKGVAGKAKVQRLTKEIVDTILKEDFDILVFEKPFNVKGNALILLELLGAIKYGLWEHGVSFESGVYEVPQTVIKKFATGKGGAQKSDMVLQAYKEFGVDNKSEDEVDAFWIATFGMYLDSIPKKAFKYRKEVINDYLKKLK